MVGLDREMDGIDGGIYGRDGTDIRMSTSVLYSAICCHQDFYQFQYRICLYEDVILPTICANTSPYTTILPVDHALNIL